MFDINNINASLLASPTSDRAADLAGPVRSSEIKPEVTWEITNFCNLSCNDCSQSSAHHDSELTTAEGKAVIKDLAQFGVRRLNFSGGEPLLRSDLVDLVGFATEVGISSTIATNGTLLNLAKTNALRQANVKYVSLLLEGIGREVDLHRRTPGSYRAVLQAYKNCVAAGVQAGVRVPLNQRTYHELSDILDLVEREQIRHVVFSHPIGRKAVQEGLSHPETRQALDQLFTRAEDFQKGSISIQISTELNYADPIYYYLQLGRKNPLVAQSVRNLFTVPGAQFRGAGVGAAGIDCVGNVHPDGFWVSYTLGNVRDVPFSKIWKNSQDSLLQGLRDRLPRLKGQCANCRWNAWCGGNMRVRAEKYFEDPWAADPACYLTSDEIDKENPELFESMEDDVLLAESAA